jgi:cellulose synthase (UDP-forming)
VTSAESARDDAASYQRQQLGGLATLLSLATAAEREPGRRPVAEREPILGQHPAPVALAPRPGKVLVPVRPAALRPLTVREQQSAVALKTGQRGRHATRRTGRLPLRQRVTYSLLVFVGLLLAVRFAVFWFSPARLPEILGTGPDGWDLLLFGGLTFVVWHRQTMDILAWLICGRVEAQREPPAPPAGLRVAFITTFVPASESIDMLEGTLRAMLAAEYPHDTWVLDEGDDPAVRRLCDALGVNHFTRHGIARYHQETGAFLTKSKAGNHNAWYSEQAAKYDIVAQIDSDFIVRPDFLTRTLGHFRNPQVGFVGTPQIYGNTGNWIARGAAQQTYLFYGPIMRALSHRRMALMIGANHIVRVAALRDIGWYQGHLTEDLATGMRLHAARWESVYVPEPLAVGEGPTTWAAYFNQQYRWAFGCMNIFFCHSPRVNYKMRLKHGLLYFLLEQFYFSGLAMVIAATLLMVYYLFGWAPARIQFEQLAWWYGPLLGWRQLIPFWLQRFNVRPLAERGIFWAGRFLTIAAIPIYFLALLGVARNKRVTFKTTPKGSKGGSADEESLLVFKPHLIVSGTIMAGLALAVLLGHTSPIFLAWGSVTAVLLFSFFFAKLSRRIVNTLRNSRAAASVPGVSGIMRKAVSPEM